MEMLDGEAAYPTTDAAAMMSAGHRDAHSETVRSIGAIVLPFKLRPLVRPRPVEGNRFDLRDRVTLEEWRPNARACGYSRIEIECGSGQDGVGDFALIYEEGREWASWGVGREAGAYHVWRCGTTGYLPPSLALGDALDLVLQSPKRLPRGAFRVS